jgi:Lrp/AsnC family leucine-responsive transcriptional regulator
MRIAITAAVLITLCAATAAAELPTVELRIKGQRVVAEIAATEATRTTGLMNRFSLQPDHGMLFVFQAPQALAFWMKNTYMPLSIAFIGADGRIANIDLADAVSLSPSACLRRVKALEASGIIAGYHAEVSRARAGFGLTVFIGLKVEKHSQETSTRVEQALLAIPAIVACYLVSGTSDFLVEAAVPDLAGYEQLLLGQILTIPSVIEAQSTFAIRTILSRGPLPMDHWRR